MMKYQKILIRKWIDADSCREIKKLEKLCLEHEGIHLKLELDYKLAASSTAEDHLVDKANEFLYYIDEMLVGYLGINDFGGSALEVNGMVHPEYRKQGVFKALFSLAVDQWQKRKPGIMLLLSDSRSNSGISFIESTGAKYDHTEYDMTLSDMLYNEASRAGKGLVLRAAVNEDSDEISRQNAIYFNEGIDEQEPLDIEEELRRGFHIFIAQLDGKPIGKTHLHIANGEGGIYGLGVVPEERGKGFGRELLITSVEKLKELGADKIFLQVDAENDNALSLYKSAGFVETHSMRYYKLDKKGRDV